VMSLGTRWGLIRHYWVLGPVPQCGYDRVA
jgi:hypothetical protein